MQMCFPTGLSSYLQLEADSLRSKTKNTSENTTNILLEWYLDLFILDFRDKISRSAKFGWMLNIIMQLTPDWLISFWTFSDIFKMNNQQLYVSQVSLHILCLFRLLSKENWNYWYNLILSNMGQHDWVFFILVKFYFC